MGTTAPDLLNMDEDQPPLYSKHIPPPPPPYSDLDETTPLFNGRNTRHGPSYSSQPPTRHVPSQPTPRSSRYTEYTERRRQHDRQNKRPKKRNLGVFWRTLLRVLEYTLAGAILGALLVGTLLLGRLAWNWYGIGEQAGEDIVRVGIIGAGPAGIAAAHTLSQLRVPKSKDHKNIRFEIVIIEQNSHVGGRLVIPQTLSTTDTLHHEIHAEDLATSCLARNSILTARARAAGLDFGILRDGDDTTTNVGFFDGNHVLSELPRPRKSLGFWAWGKLLWRYGASVCLAAKLPTGTMNGYHNMLSHTNSMPYENTWDILFNGGMESAASLSANARLSINRVGGRYIDEILRPQVRRQTGNELEDLSDLALSIALEREDLGLCLDGQEGSFQDLMKKFASASKATIKLDTQVTGLKYSIIDETKSSWILESNNSTSTNESMYDLFDQIILAAPLNNTRLGLGDIDDEVMYKSTYITFVATTSPPGSKQQILYTKPKIESTEIYELSYIRPLFHLNSLVNTTYLYKLTSNTTLSDTTIATLLNNSIIERISRTKIENAWPVTMPRSNADELNGFEVEGKKGLWGMGGAEGIVASVEWSWVVGEGIGRAVGRGVERDRDRKEGSG